MTKLFTYKFIILITLTFCSMLTFAQAKKLKVKKEKTVHYSLLTFDLYYGNRIYDKDYYSQINTLTKKDLNLPMSFVGLGVSGYEHHFKSKIWVFQFNYYKILPSQVNIQDSLNTKLSGYIYGAALGPSLSTPKKNLSVAAYFGFNSGRTTLSKNEFISQKNQFFSPKIVIQPKVIIKRIAISLMLSAEYDVSNPAWRQTYFERKEPHLLQPFHQTCYTALLSIGYKWSK